MRKYYSFVCFITVFFLIFSLCGCKKSKTSQNITDSENSSAAGEEKTEISLSDMDFSFTERETDPEKNSSPLKELTEKNIKITDEGCYSLSGEYNSVTVDADNTKKIQIILNNAQISNSEGPAIYIRQADKVFITLAAGSENILSDGSSYTGFSGNEENTDAALFSRADLCINGSGTLQVNGNYKCGIASKDDLVITGGIIKVTSKGNAIEGKDCVKICNGEITVNSGGDGIRSTNSEDSNRGFIYISGGSFNITSVNDAFQAQTALKIDNGDFKLTSGGGSANSSTSNPDWGNWGRFDRKPPSSSDTETTESAKALKAASLISLSGGSFNIDSSDDSLHSNGDIEINGGEINCTSGDDGIHADSSLIINNGNITINKSYEGIEAVKITVNNGNIDVTASDDGFNAAGGNDGSSLNGRPGQNPFESDSNAFIAINGGYILVNASGDGIDSNGSISMTNGIMLVSGPENNGNGAFDYGISAEISGGYAILTGSSGMAQGFSSSSSQCSLLYNTNAFEGGSSVALTDKSGNVMLSFIPEKRYSSIVFSCPSMKQGETVKILIGSTISKADKNGFATSGNALSEIEKFEIELTSVSTSYGSGGMGGGMGGHQRPGGMGGGRGF